MTGPLELADDALIAAQRLSEWVSRAPTLEEDVALANIALDQLGVARLLLQSLGDEDELAYGRGDGEFRNCLLVELPLGPARGDLDFGWTVVWLLFLAAAQKLRYEASGDPVAAGGGSGGRGLAEGGLAEGGSGGRGSGGRGLAEGGLAEGGSGSVKEVAAKAVKESAYHLDHATQWTIRLGDGTPESHRRVQEAVHELWPYTHELTEGIREDWLSIVEPVLAEATLTRPESEGWRPSGGRGGRHTEHLSYLLAEMQALHRAHPGAQW